MTGGIRPLRRIHLLYTSLKILCYVLILSFHVPVGDVYCNILGKHYQILFAQLDSKIYKLIKESKYDHDSRQRVYINCIDPCQHLRSITI